MGNIPYDATEEQLSDLMREAGQVINFRLVIDKDTGKSKGVGLCEFVNATTAQCAIRNLNGREFHGRTLRVDKLDEKEANAMNPPPVFPNDQKALLDQIMSLTPEQITAIPPSERAHILELRKAMGVPSDVSPHKTPATTGTKRPLEDAEASPQALKKPRYSTGPELHAKAMAYIAELEKEQERELEKWLPRAIAYVDKAIEACIMKNPMVKMVNGSFVLDIKAFTIWSHSESDALNANMFHKAMNFLQTHFEQRDITVMRTGSTGDEFTFLFSF